MHQLIIPSSISSGQSCELIIENITLEGIVASEKGVLILTHPIIRARKRFDAAPTPYQRTLESPDVSEEDKNVFARFTSPSIRWLYVDASTRIWRNYGRCPVTSSLRPRYPLR